MLSNKCALWDWRRRLRLFGVILFAFILRGCFDELVRFWAIVLALYFMFFVLFYLAVCAIYFDWLLCIILYVSFNFSIFYSFSYSYCISNLFCRLISSLHLSNTSLDSYLLEEALISWVINWILLKCSLSGIFSFRVAVICLSFEHDLLRNGFANFSL